MLDGDCKSLGIVQFHKMDHGEDLQLLMILNLIQDDGSSTEKLRITSVVMTVINTC